MKYLIILFLLFLSSQSEARICTDKDEKYAKEDSRIYGDKRTFTAEESAVAGYKIIQAFKDKDLKTILSMIDGELKYGPKKSYFKGKTFDQAFQKKFVDLITSSKPRCALSDSNHGFDVGNTLIWYDKNKDDKWVIRKINYITKDKDMIKK